MTGPEALHRKLTSGNPGTLRGLADDLHTAVTDLAGCVDHIVQANAVPQWQSPQGAQAFARNAWATEAMVQVAQVRCDRAKLAMQRGGAGYTWASGEADRLIEWWYTQKERTTSPSSRA